MERGSGVLQKGAKGHGGGNGMPSLRGTKFPYRWVLGPYVRFPGTESRSIPGSNRLKRERGPRALWKEGGMNPRGQQPVEIGREDLHARLGAGAARSDWRG